VTATVAISLFGQVTVAMHHCGYKYCLLTHAGTLARLFDVERQAGEGSGHSVSEAMAAAETCPMGALEHTAVSILV
jgi:hypothetical protein